MKRLVVLVATPLALLWSASSPQPTASIAPSARPAAAVASRPDRGETDVPGDTLGVKEGSGKAVQLPQYRTAQQQAAAVPTGSTAAWSMVGPANIGGRVTDLALDSTAQVVYAATATGGVWKSADKGATWVPAWPAANVQAIGAIALGPDGTLWAGTGEANPSGGGLTFFGNGVYRSTDHGATWALAGLPDSGAIGRIVVNPQDAREVWAAAAGDVSQSVLQRGIYHTTDSGVSWTQALAPTNDSTGGIDIALSPTTPHTVYASLWDHHRNSGSRTYGGIGSGLYRSTDDGATWTRLQNISGSVCAWDQAKTGLQSDPSLGRIGIAVAPSDASRVYIEFGSQYGPDKGFYTSSDAGTTFACGGEAGASATAGYEWWFGRVFVNPLNELDLFSADVYLRQSVDGGMHWATVTNTTTGGASGSTPGDAHADQHAMVFDPANPGRVYLGNDGGVYRSDADGAPDSWFHGTYEPWNQIYHLAIAHDDPTRLAIGLQDQGSWGTWTATSNPSDLSGGWTSYDGGDGHYVAIDPSDHTYFYACYQPVPPTVDCAMFHDSTTRSSQTVSSSAWPAGTRFTTDTPLVLDPSNPSVVYVGGTSLGRSTNRGASFTLISPSTPDSADSLPGPVPADEQDRGPFYANEYGAITAIAPSTSDPNTIYAGTDTGRTWVTHDLGVHWTLFSGLPAQWVNAIVVDPADASHAVVAFSGYREGNDSANVFETTDAGATWTNISGALPNAPVEMLTFDPGTRQLFAATGFGAFYETDGSGQWLRLGTELPNAPVFDIKVSGDGQTVFAATFGRGIWKIPMPSPNAILAEVPSPVLLVGLLGAAATVVAVRRRRRLAKVGTA